MDTAADITIIGIAVVAKLRKRDLKPTDKTPGTYDHQIFYLDGFLDTTLLENERQGTASSVWKEYVANSALFATTSKSRRVTAEMKKRLTYPQLGYNSVHSCDL